MTTDLEERIAFEGLISELSAEMISVPPERVDQAIEEGLARLKRYFRADQVALLRVNQEARSGHVSHAAVAEGYDRVPSDVDLAPLFPDGFDLVIDQGRVRVVTDVEDLPPSVDRDSYRTLGIRAVLDIPLRLFGVIRYVLTIHTTSRAHAWPEAFLPRLRLVGEVFLGALERKRSEAVLRESEERARLSAVAARVGLWSIDVATGRMWVTDTARSLFAFELPSDATLEDFLGLVHPEDRERVRQAVRILWEEGEGPRTIEYRVTLRDGDTRRMLSIGRIVETVNGPRLTGVTRDVTDERRAEAAVREQYHRIDAASEVAGLGFYVVSWDDRRVSLEVGLRELLAIPPGEEARVLEWWEERIHPEDLEAVHATRRRVVGESGEGLNTVEYRFRHPAKGEVWLRHTVRRISGGEDGRGVRNLGVLQDVTEAKRTELELRRSLDELGRLRNELEQQNVLLREQITQEGGGGAIVGESEPVQRMLAAVRRVASTDAGVLVTGETGTGKELLAEAIHQGSARRNRPMVRVNCAALPSTLIESELFGRERGAYTGAMTSQVGRFEQANGSTLFLDEISELSPEVQPKLLRVLQDGQFERLGGRTTLKVDVRVIAATNRDLASLVAQGRFRSDLFYRLSVFPIQAPPLRERRDDIPLLVWHFVRHFAQKMGKSIDTVPRKTMERLREYPWPGNVRELRNLIERSVILSDTRVLNLVLPEDAPPEECVTALEEVERLHILKVLSRTGWRIRGAGGAAELLAMNPSTLHSRLKKLAISRTRP